MATLNYAKRLANLQSRKFDRELNESLFSKSAYASLLPENVKYLVESMRPIDQKYNDRTNEAANRVKKHMEDAFSLHFNRVYRAQGSVTTGTNIRVHSDFDLLTIIDRYQYLHHDIPNNNPYTATNPDTDILDLRNQTTSILKKNYTEVDDTCDKNISVVNKSLNRKIDVVFCFWYDTKKFRDTGNEYYRGIYLYDFPKKNKDLDYPFAHLGQVNSKGNNTLDGSRRGIRLLKTLKADSETELKQLNSFQLTTIVHSIADERLRYSAGSELSIAKAVSAEMDSLLQNSTYRKSIISPNGIEKPLADDKVVLDINILKQDLDGLIQDCEKEINRSVLLQTAIRSY
jgi:hypothetical protein